MSAEQNAQETFICLVFVIVTRFAGVRWGGWDNNWGHPTICRATCMLQDGWPIFNPHIVSPNKDIIQHYAEMISLRTAWGPGSLQ